jgi:hypothetical protein
MQKRLLNMLELIKFIFCVFGMVSIFDLLTDRIEFLKIKPFTCSLCMGFWMSFLLCYLMGYGFSLMLPFIGAGTTFLLTNLIKKKI